MAFFVISLAVFGSGYAYVGFRLTGSLGTGATALVWGVLLVHFASIFAKRLSKLLVGENQIHFLRPIFGISRIY